MIKGETWPGGRIRLLPLLVVALLGAGAAVPAAADNRQAGRADPAATVIRLQAGLLRADRLAAKTGSRQREAAFEPLIAATHDLAYMARLSLGPAWEALSAEERERFSGAFRRLSVLNYATRFRDMQHASFRIESVGDAAGSRASVSSVLLAPPASPVPLGYVLHLTTDGWRIINVLAGASANWHCKERSTRSSLRRTGSMD